jgi:transmembrane sensor
MNKQLLDKYFRGECSKEEVSYILSLVESGKLDDFLSEKILTFNKDQNYEEINIDEKNMLSKIHDLIYMEELIEHVKKEDQIDEDNQLYLKNINKSEIEYEGRWITKVNLLAASISLFFIMIAFSNQFIFNNNINELVVANNEKIEIIEKETLKGQKLTIHLNDGTEVILNSGSKITYPLKFSDNERKVDIEGEAFFEVSPDPNRPFLVRSSNIETKVLGTSFNIQSIPELGIYKVALVTGKLMVEKVTINSNVDKMGAMVLNPGEMADLDSESGQLSKLPFNVEEFTAWKDGVIYFKDAGHRKVINTLENWYGVEIQTIGKPQREWKFTSKIQKDNLKNVLEILKAAQDIDYNIHGNKVEIFLNKVKD